MSERYSDNPAFGVDETNSATGKPNSEGEAADKVADNIKYGDQAQTYADAAAAKAEGSEAESVDAPAEDTPAEDDTVGGYEPSDFTVDEVNTYLADNPDQVDTILERERGGKARVGILGDE